MPETTLDVSVAVDAEPAHHIEHPLVRAQNRVSIHLLQRPQRIAPGQLRRAICSLLHLLILLEQIRQRIAEHQTHVDYLVALQFDKALQEVFSEDDFRLGFAKLILVTVVALSDTFAH